MQTACHKRLLRFQAITEG